MTPNRAPFAFRAAVLATLAVASSPALAADGGRHRGLTLQDPTAVTLMVGGGPMRGADFYRERRHPAQDAPGAGAPDQTGFDMAAGDYGLRACLRAGLGVL